MLNGGHYISYGCNPNGHWYCYNDSSCREVATELESDNNNSLKNSNRNTDSRDSNFSGCTPLARRKNTLSTSTEHLRSSPTPKERSNSINSIKSNSSSTLVSNSSYLHGSADIKVDGLSNHSSPRASPNLRRSSNHKLNEDSHSNKLLYESKSSLNSFKCAYSDMKIPKIDTSSAYILFYERSGLNYQPYLPEVVSNNQSIPEVELDESESELRKQLCNLQ